ncbi:MAG: prolyl oligopeptidase family serine peptidase [Gammaproteobacteria bacterium]
MSFSGRDSAACRLSTGGSAPVIQALIDAGKPYQLLIYPNKTHGISGPGARTHLFTAMEKFCLQQLK